MKGTIQSIQVGRPRNYDGDDGRSWISSIAKSPVAGSVHVTFTNVVGDEQSDLVHHGGGDKAVLGYSSDHFGHWRKRFPERRVDSGSFGENLTIAGLTETDLCIGDIFQAGSCRFQISQPRQPCWKLARFWNEPSLVVEVQKSGRTGWYLRVLCEGILSAGDWFELVERPCPDLSVAWSNDVMHAKPRRKADDLRLADCPLLSASWRKELQQRSAPTDEGSNLAKLAGADD